MTMFFWQNRIGVHEKKVHKMILSNFYMICFSIFWPFSCEFDLEFQRSANMTWKNFSLQKIRTGIEKMQNFTLIPIPMIKMRKNSWQESYPTCQKKCRKFEFVHFHYCLQKFWAKTISVSIFFIYYLSRFKISVKFWVFRIVTCKKFSTKLRGHWVHWVLLVELPGIGQIGSVVKRFLPFSVFPIQ